MRKMKVKSPEKETATTASEEDQESSLRGVPSVGTQRGQGRAPGRGQAVPPCLGGTHQSSRGLWQGALGGSGSPSVCLCAPLGGEPRRDPQSPGRTSLGSARSPWMQGDNDTPWRAVFPAQGVPRAPPQLSPNPWICPTAGLATAWFGHGMVASQGWQDTAPAGAGRNLVPLGHRAPGRDTAGHRTAQIPAPQCSRAVSRGVAGHTVAAVAASQLPIPSRPRCHLQLPHYYSARSLPEQAAPLWGQQPENRGSASGAAHRRPPEPGWDGALRSARNLAQSPHRCRGPSVGPQTRAEPLGDARGTRVAPARGARSVPVPVSWPRCPALEPHRGLLRVLESGI